jgi:ABC transporter substrate binding protein (PQQ-dependent alcohol dehydrogenase system)
MAIEDVAAIGEAVGRRFVLVERSLSEDDDPAAVLTDFVAREALDAVIVDLPLDATRAAVTAPANRRTLTLNIRHRSDELRQEACATALLHVAPSEAMIADALAQYLASRNWRKVLVLEGGAPEDKPPAAAFRRAAKKFALKIVATKPFVLGNDPRKRDQINVALLTADNDYDVVFVAEAAGDFARSVPFQTYLPRPVVGSAGLAADAWHVAWERQGAPQLTRRFWRTAHRPMLDADWAAWVAVRALVEVSVQFKEKPLATAILEQDLTVDGYKGAPGSFRTWDRQLRQPILLHTADAVVAYAPLDGFLHQVNVLDTLGLDKPEFKCTAK